MIVEKDIFIPMRDGVELALDVYHPDSPGPHPAILVRTPYCKDGNPGGGLGAEGWPRQMTGPTPPPQPGRNPLTANYERFVEAGYVVVVNDIRGTGFSEGVYDYYNVNTQDGYFDGFDVVEWVAGQPWCDGNVGMWGVSAGAILAYATAITQPPHLRALVAHMHPSDLYFDVWYVGGVFRYEDRLAWCTNQVNNNNPRPPGDPSGPNYEKKRRVYTERFNRMHQRLLEGKGPYDFDWLQAMYAEKTYSAAWQRRSFARQLDRITVPVLHGGVWHDHFTRGTVVNHEGLSTPKRLFIAPGALDHEGVAGDGGFPALQVRWFDHFLRGIDNGVMNEPLARLFLTGAAEWRDEPAWPLPTVDRALFLAPGGNGGAASANDGLLAEAPAATAAPIEIHHDPVHPNRTPRHPSDQRSFEAGCLTFSTPVLSSDLEVVGRPHLKLFASSDAVDVDWCVRLCDVYPDGRAQFLNLGALKGRHVSSHEHPGDLEPGKIYEFDIEVWPVGNLFRAGHRIRVDVSTSDFPTFEVNAVPSHNRVYIDAGHPSRLILPEVRR